MPRLNLAKISIQTLLKRKKKILSHELNVFGNNVENIVHI